MIHLLSFMHTTCVTNLLGIQQYSLNEHTCIQLSTVCYLS